MTETLELPEYDAVFRELREPGRAGLLVSQHGRTYFARSHLLTPETRAIIMAAVDAGLTAFWKHGHPGDDKFEGGELFHHGSHHIQFSKDHHAPWTFVIGAENRPPHPTAVTFNKKLEPIVNEAARKAGFNDRFEYQVVGGKNFTVPLDRLDFVLSIATDPETQAFLAARGPRRAPTPRCPAFLSEDALQAALADELGRRGFAVAREVKVSTGEIDLVATREGETILIEVKLHACGRPVFDQIARYVRAYAAERAGGRLPKAALIARHFQDDLLAHARAQPLDLAFVTYGAERGGAVALTGRGEPHGASMFDPR